MSEPVVPLLGANLKSWISGRGFAMVVAAALLPLALTGAWVTTHRADLAADSLTVPSGTLHEKQAVNFTGVVKNTGSKSVGAFNATLAVGRVFAGRLQPSASQNVHVDGLAPGATKEITLAWNATAGTYFALLDVDAEDAIAEVDEFNNQLAKPVAVAYSLPSASDAPKAPANLTGNAASNATAALTLTGFGGADGALVAGDNRSFTVTVSNAGPDATNAAQVTFRVGRVFQGQMIPAQSTTQTLALAPGEKKDVTLAWQAEEGVYWLDASVNMTDAKEANGADNHATRAIAVDPKVDPNAEPPKPPEKLTIKEFYLQVLSLLHLRILIPFIGLFYAAGVIADERERGTLAYLLTRPVARWLIPLTRFVASFVVALLALLVGVLGTYFLLFGTVPHGGDVGFLTTPLLVSALALFVYGSFFTLLGVLVDRPYLIGAAFVVGWETLAGNFVPFVKQLTISQHLLDAIGGWKLDQGVQWLPSGDAAVHGLEISLVVAVACLVASAVVMKRREFEL